MNQVGDSYWAVLEQFGYCFRIVFAKIWYTSYDVEGILATALNNFGTALDCSDTALAQFAKSLGR